MSNLWFGIEASSLLALTLETHIQRFEVAISPLATQHPSDVHWDPLVELDRRSVQPMPRALCHEPICKVREDAPGKLLVETHGTAELRRWTECRQDKMS